MAARQKRCCSLLFLLFRWLLLLWLRWFPLPRSAVWFGSAALGQSAVVVSAFSSVPQVRIRIALRVFLYAFFQLLTCCPQNKLFLLFCWSQWLVIVLIIAATRINQLVYNIDMLCYTLYRYLYCNFYELNVHCCPVNWQTFNIKMSCREWRKLMCC
jgi:hypothetical protein